MATSENTSQGLLMWENTLSGMGLGVLSVLVGAGVPDSPHAASHNELPAYAAEAAPSPVFAVRVSDGETLWGFDPGMFSRIDLPRLLATTDGVYLAGKEKVDCVDAQTGTRVRLGGDGQGCFPLVDTGNVTVGNGGDPADTGAPNIATMLSGNGETNRSSPYDVNLKQCMDDNRNRNRSSAAEGVLMHEAQAEYRDA
ncbi:hypothetical protein DFJ73DRAFT_760090 [Zopfochytrium polystomum]|nr:hypothetical protein DFJ73DRAFT_760090 [Zopfochytrium polystomum]